MFVTLVVILVVFFVIIGVVLLTSKEDVDKQQPTEKGAGKSTEEIIRLTRR